MTFKYSTTLNTRPFLYQETLQIARLLVAGESEKTIASNVYEDNIFQIKSKDRMKSFYNEIRHRLAYLNEHLLREFVTSDKQTSKMILLWGILQRDRLFFEWMNEVVREKMLINDLQLYKKETVYFMAEKQEQNSVVAKWTEQTVKRLINAYHQALVDSEFANKETNGLKLNPLILDPIVKETLLKAADAKYINVLGGGNM